MVNATSLQVEERTRQRQLEAVDMFLETARSHLKTLSTGDRDEREGLPPATQTASDPIDKYVRPQTWHEGKRHTVQHTLELCHCRTITLLV